MKQILLALLAASSAAVAADRPNILWITSEDHGPHMGCYGDKNAVTPNVDALAAQGMLFKRAWSCAPVCAPARTTIISGMYPPSLGAEHMRSEVPMPKGREDVSAISPRGRLLLLEQLQGGLQPHPARRSVGRIFRPGALEETRRRPAVLRHLQRHRQSREPVAHPAAQASPRSCQGARARLPPGHAGSAAGLGAVLRQGQRGRRHRRKTLEGTRRCRPRGGHHRLLLRRPRLRHAAQQTLAEQLRLAGAVRRLLPGQVAAPRAQRIRGRRQSQTAS